MDHRDVVRRSALLKGSQKPQQASINVGLSPVRIDGLWKGLRLHVLSRQTRPFSGHLWSPKHTSSAPIFAWSPAALAVAFRLPLTSSAAAGSCFSKFLAWPMMLADTSSAAGTARSPTVRAASFRWADTSFAVSGTYWEVNHLGSMNVMLPVERSSRMALLLMHREWYPRTMRV